MIIASNPPYIILNIYQRHLYSSEWAQKPQLRSNSAERSVAGPTSNILAHLKGHASNGFKASTIEYSANPQYQNPSGLDLPLLTSL
jgi:hypothetical protein